MVRRAARESMTLMYRLVTLVAVPILYGWGRMRVRGVEVLPPTGPLLVVANHDSHWDPVVIACAARRRRQFRALAKHSLWRNPVLAFVLDQMRQIPIERGAKDTDALGTAVQALEHGDAIGVFPEGTISRGVERRARSGAGRLAQAVPGTTIVSCRVVGAVDIVRFPRRPRITVEFFRPTVTDTQYPTALVRRLMAEIRAGAPFAPAGRRPAQQELPRAA